MDMLSCAGSRGAANRKQAGLFTMVAIAWLLISGCGREAPKAAEPGAQPDSTEVVRVLVSPYLSWAPIVLAEENGHFAAMGIEIDPVHSNREVQIVPALVQGELDVYGGMLNSGLFNAMARGAAVRIVADKGHLHDPQGRHGAFLVRRELIESGRVKKPEDLRGRVVSRTETSAADYLTELLLSTGGLTYDDVELANVPQVSRIPAMEAGTIDLVQMGEPWATRALRSNAAAIFMTVGELYPGFQNGLLYFGPRLIDKERGLGERFMAAYLMGVADYHAGKTEHNLKVLEDFTGLDRELLLEASWPEIRLDGEVHVETLLGFQEWAVGRRYLERVVPIEDCYDDGFLKPALDLIKQRRGEPEVP